jgi:hypothetical protein
MFVFDKIKFIADENYDEYERRICYNKYSYINSSSLTNYIFSAYIQKGINCLFYTDPLTLLKVKLYFKNILFAYYKYYIKEIICDGMDYFLDAETFDNFICQNRHKFQKYVIDYFKNSTDLSFPISLDKYISGEFEKSSQIPKFSLYQTSYIDLHAFIAQLLDYIVDINSTKTIIYIAMNSLQTDLR